jgi:hypothetical protein
MSIDSLVTKYGNAEALHVKAQGRGWQDSAVEELARDWAEQFDANQRHRSTGQSMEDFIKTYERERPHVMIHQASNYDDVAMRLTAFLGDNGTRSLTELGKLRKHLGSDEALATAAFEFGIDNPYDLKQRGVAPGNMGKLIDAKKASAEADELEARAKVLRAAANLAAPKPAGDHAANPWSAKGWNLTKAAALVKSLGPAKASAIAASVGCTFSSTRPNPAYNK